MRTIDYDVELFLKAEEYFQEVEELLTKEESGQFYVRDKFVLIVSEFLGKYYVGMKEVLEDGEVDKKSGINFDSVEWKVLMSHWDTIKRIIQKKKSGMKRKLADEYHGDVYMHKWKWVINDKIVRKSNVGFYSEEESLRDGMSLEGMIKAMEDIKNDPEAIGELKLVSEMFLTEAPESTEHMRLLYYYMLEKKIEEMSKAECKACKVNSDSQIDHMKFGNCLGDAQSVVNKVTEFFPQSVTKVTANDLCDVFYATRRMIGARPIFAQQLARSAIAYIPHSDIKEALFNENYVPSDMIGLFSIIEHCVRDFAKAKC